MRIGILIFDKVEEMDFVGPLKVLAGACVWRLSRLKPWPGLNSAQGREVIYE